MITLVIWHIPNANERSVRRLSTLLDIAPLTAKILVNRGLSDPQRAANFLYAGMNYKRWWLRRFIRQLTTQEGITNAVGGRKQPRSTWWVGKRLGRPVRLKLSMYPQQEPLPEGTLPPAELPGLTEAVALVRKWIAAGKTVVVYHDYDVDGMTSASILVQAIQAAGGKAVYRCPDRFNPDEGYGVHDHLLASAYESGYDCILCTDTGISAGDVIKKARARGQEIVILDHHEAPDELPPANVVVDPKIRTRPYPFEGLCAGFIAHKFDTLLNGAEEAYKRIEIAALATVADVMPLLSENRTLVREGLKRMNDTSSAGLKALMAIAGVDPAKEVRSFTLAYLLAPRLNALGRMYTARPGVKLLLAGNADDALKEAQKADYFNKQRKLIEEKITDSAIAQWNGMEAEERAYATVVASDGWGLPPEQAGKAAGVVGIVASRMVEETLRPSFILTIDKVPRKVEQPDGRVEVEITCTDQDAPEIVYDLIAKGSARSVPGLNLYDALCECSDLLIKFGGHAAAAGLTLLAKDVPEFRRRINQAVFKQIGDAGLIPQIDVDAVVSLSDVTIENLRELDLFEPTGQDNPRPCVLVQGVRVTYAGLGRDNKTLRMVVADRYNPAMSLEVVQFRYAKPGKAFNLPQKDSVIDVVGYLDVNTYNGADRPQLRLKYWQASPTQDDVANADNVGA